MSVSSQITRIQDDRNTIRTKLVDLGLVTSVANLDDCADAVDGIVNRGAVSATIREGDTYTIPAGYHNGAGTVTGVGGGGSYTLQAKTVTPTKSQNTVSPDAGYYGLSSVTVNAIPDNYQDITSTTALAGDVLATKVFVGSDGVTTAGTMPNNGAVSASLNTVTTLYTVPAGYHSGSGTVSITTETKSATPTESSQEITPSTGKVLSKVTVNAIPSKYADATDMTATAAQILSGQTAISWSNNAPVEITGIMANRGAVSQTLDTTTTSYTIPVGYHNGSGSVGIVTETKTATPTTTAQDIVPTSGRVLSKVTVNAIQTETKTATPSTSAQTITPASGKYLSSVTVNPIPSQYVDASTVTAVAGNVLEDTIAVVKSGTSTVVAEGTMHNNGAVIATITGLGTVAGDTSYTIPVGYHNGSGTVSLTSDIENQLAAI